MSISIRYQFSQVENVARAMHAIENLNKHELLDELGAEVESQVRRRIHDEKHSPEGIPWPAWSPAYAKTRHGNQSLLQGDGGLLDSIQYVVSGGEVEIGSNLPYAAIHNEGGKIKRKERASTVHFHQDSRTGEVGNRFVKKSKSNFAQDVTIGAHEIEMPQRQYLGFSAENEGDLQHVVEDFLRRQLSHLQ